MQRSPASQSRSTIEDRRAQRERSLVIQPDIEAPGSKQTAPSNRRKPNPSQEYSETVCWTKNQTEESRQHEGDIKSIEGTQEVQANGFGIGGAEIIEKTEMNT